MPIVSSPGLILQTYRFGDTSKILRLLTRDHGPVSALARGALRPRSRMSGVLEPFVEGTVTLYMKANRDLHTLSGFELVRARQALGADMSRFAGASVLAELVLRLAPAERDDRLFATLRAGLDDLVRAGPDEVVDVSLSRIWQLVGVLGFEPSLDECQSCGRPIGAEEGAAFDTLGGGILCVRCDPREAILSPAALGSLRALAGGGGGSVREGPQLHLLREFIRVHVAEGVRIRSLEFLAIDGG